jgi:diguanylate cyclase (GGDEF)-like protein
MPTDPSHPSHVNRVTRSPFSPDAVAALFTDMAARRSLAEKVQVLAVGLAKVIQAPVAVLSRASDTWRFEAQGFPEEAAAQRSLGWAVTSMRPSADDTRQSPSVPPWTLVALGLIAGREWSLLIPASVITASEQPGFQELTAQLTASLERVKSTDCHDDDLRRFARRLHAFSRRLAREHDGDLYPMVLRTVGAQARARTGALAVFQDAEQTLSIVATYGYPLSLVEHLRIQPGEGILGRAFQAGRPFIGDADEQPHSPRLRYRTKSFMVIPILAGGQRLAVIALTDRADGGAFEQRDFEVARMFAGVTAPALTRERVSRTFDELSRTATIDPVTGLFNRRYFESRILGEVERARRQHQDLALLMIDIDDFKRVNDTKGHLEGDRTLREVAELLRQNVRIFDVCARYGGEEFAIVMPSATTSVATQVAERIRGQIERHFSHETPPVTVSIGIGMLEREGGTRDLIEIADRALLVAKETGKNAIRVDQRAHGAQTYSGANRREILG